MQNLISSREIFTCALSELDKHENNNDKCQDILKELINLLMIKMELGEGNAKILEYYPSWLKTF